MAQSMEYHGTVWGPVPLRTLGIRTEPEEREGVEARGVRHACRRATMSRREVWNMPVHKCGGKCFPLVECIPPALVARESSGEPWMLVYCPWSPRGALGGIVFPNSFGYALRTENTRTVRQGPGHAYVQSDTQTHSLFLCHPHPHFTIWS